MPTPTSAFLLSALASFDVQGSSTCPRPEEVSIYLAAVPSDDAHRVELDFDSDMLRVRLLDRRGALLGERELERNSSCTELAEAAAVLVSAWTIEMPAVELPALEPETALAVAPLEPAPGDMPKTLAEVPPSPPPPPSVRAPPAIETTPFTAPVIYREPNNYERAGSHDVNVGFSASVGSRLTRANGIMASYLFWPLAGLAIEGAVNLHFDHGTGGLADGVLYRSTAPDPPDLHVPLWNISAGAVVSFARGPVRVLGLMSGPSVELYGVLGAGIGGLQPTESFSVELFQITDLIQPRPIFDVGGGVRSYLYREALALELELRDFFFADPSGIGLTHNVQLQVGLRFAVDPTAWRARDLPDRARSRAGRFSITPAAGTSLLDGFSSTRVLSLAVAYDLFDFVGIETLGAYLPGAPNALTRDLVERTFGLPPLARLTELRWAVAFGLRVNLLRGRFTPLGLPFGGDLTLYLAGGGGFGRTRVICMPESRLDPEVHGEDAFCGPPPLDFTEDEVAFVYEPSRFTGLGHVGGGMTLELIDWLGLTVEVRDFIFHTTVVRPDSIVNPSTEALRHVFVGQLGVTLLL